MFDYLCLFMLRIIWFQYVESFLFAVYFEQFNSKNWFEKCLFKSHEILLLAMIIKAFVCL